MPTYECKKCGRKTRAQPLYYSTGCFARKIEQPFEKPPHCCGQSMIETIEN